MSWTLTTGSTTKTLADWGISGLRRSCNSQALDSLTFSLDGTAFDAASPFTAGSEIVVTRDGTTWFRGRVVAVRRVAVGSDERLEYQVAGPWWYLEQLVYQQPWAIQGASDAWKTHCLLNITKTGLAWSTRDQIDDALTWCSGRATAQYGSAPFQWVKASIPAVNVPTDEVRDVTCAEVVRKQLRWLPNAVLWWDYATNPPTLHCVRRSDLSSVSVALGSPITSAGFTPRYDLQIPAVALKFESIDTIDGAPVAGVTTQVYPPGSTGDEFGALVASIDLQGGVASYATAHIVSAALPTTSTGWTAWLKVKHPTLASDRVTISEFVSVTREKVGAPLAAVLDYELVDGQIPVWSGATSQKEVVAIRLRYSVKNGTGSVTVDIRDEVFHVNIVTCDAATQTFSMLSEFVAGEAAPSGLAQSLYESLSPLEWEGSLTTVSDDPSTSLTIGKVVNVTGGLADWATMAAMVQATEDDVDAGSTTVRFGPPQHLGPRDLVELLRVNRFRLRITPSAVRSSGSAPSGAIALGESAPMENTTRGLGERKFHSVMDGNRRIDQDSQSGPEIALTNDGGTSKAIEMNGASNARVRVTGANGAVHIDTAGLDGNTIEFREVAICVNGVEKRMIILCSEPYDP